MPSRGRSIKELNRPAVRKAYEDSVRAVLRAIWLRATPTGRAGNAGKRVVEIATVLEHGGLDKLKLYWLAPEIEFAGLHKTQHDTLEQRKVAYLQ